MGMSEYYKFDLHIHTDKSNLTKQSDYSGQFNEDSLLKILKESGIAAYSLTDHNIFNVDAYKKLFEKPTADMKLFIGIELDLLKEEDLLLNINECTLGKKPTKKKYHSVIIFKNDNVDLLNEKLLAMYTDVQDLYNQIYKSTLDLTTELDNDDLFYRRTSLDRLFKFFREEDYLIISHGRKDSDIADAYKTEITEAQKMILLGFINSLEMSPNKVDAIAHFNEGFDKILEDDYKNRDDVPYVIFSDNHQLSAYPNYKSDQIIDNRPFTWIKGDLSFETLRISFVDPESRIRLQTSKPVKPAKYLEEINYNLFDGATERSISIPLSSGINTIVGGRSSGKSLLFNAILKNINTSRDKSNIENYCERGNKLIDIESISGKMNFEVSRKTDNVCDTVAYTQESIVKLFEEEGKKLNEELDFPIYSSETIQTELNKVNLSLDNLALKYSTFHSVQSNKDQIILVDDFSIISKEREYSYLYESGLKKLKDSLTSSSQNIIELKNEVFDALEKVKKLKDKMISGENLFSTKEKTKIDEITNILNNKIISLNSSTRIVQLKETFITKLENNLSSYINTINTQKDSTITEANTRLNNSKTKTKEYFKAKLELRKSCSETCEINVKYKPMNKKISNQYELLTEIKCEFNKDIFMKVLEEKISNFDKTDLESSLLKMIDGNELKIKRYDNQPSSFSILMNKIKGQLNSEINPKYSIVEKDGNRKNISSDHMSPGKKASTFLEIKLEMGKSDGGSKIYLIDQPEDNLDNMFITDTLIDKVRELRDNSQIILVTHNAAIAINSDSENVVICDNENGKISYSTGGIENIEFRKKICKLLDGGYYVFDRRYHKYDIPFKKIYEPINKEEVIDDKM